MIFSNVTPHILTATTSIPGDPQIKYDNDDDNIGHEFSWDKIDRKDPVLVGWVCPVCGRGLSPYTSVCPCRPFKVEITC